MHQKPFLVLDIGKRREYYVINKYKYTFCINNIQSINNMSRRYDTAYDVVLVLHANFTSCSYVVFKFCYTRTFA